MGSIFSDFSLSSKSTETTSPSLSINLTVTFSPFTLIPCSLFKSEIRALERERPFFKNVLKTIPLYSLETVYSV